eukprot:CAMPEP_0202375256 /NCGR_PEP_ID=MMETSP1127-20130417/5964_1 /ASSEMBLY_ACC=CAM_ASM_000462 /TAXON_ID=3047 /ORGANISM="Dunaliella tertiolecta, Strain CCMP1320" /LENGTH=61 /DNA_ID=CAMNT_0048972679 /DNA_START=262 /DNA_END=444 /DNA_ORIENTATION=+
MPSLLSSVQYWTCPKGDVGGWVSAAPVRVRQAAAAPVQVRQTAAAAAAAAPVRVRQAAAAP